ncbi:MAG TPA: hypothetical protein VIL65_01150 [Beijerinckiaceae bacterium]|jgi:hypothetical protein
MRFLKLATLVIAMIGGGFGLAGTASAASPAAGAAPVAEYTQYGYYGGPRYGRRPVYGRGFYGGPRYGRPVVVRRGYYGGPRFVRPVYGPRVVCRVRPRLVATPYGYVRRPVRVCARRF